MLIGLSVNHKDGLSCISNAYPNAVIKAGGVPVLIPLTNDKRILEETLSQIDGLILSGGGDIDASYFNEENHLSVTSCDKERDFYDIYLAKRAAEKQIPVLGICRGHQVLNVAFGGSLIQDIPSQTPDSKVNHNQEEAREVGTHSIAIQPDSELYQIFQKEKISVNSFHHQAIKEPAPGLKAVAHSEDGIIEAIESTEGQTIRGVQWHPENMTVEQNDTMLPLFKHLIGEIELYKQTKEIHQRILTLDSHCDTPMYFKYGIDIGKRNPVLKLNPKDLGAKSENRRINYALKVDVPKMQDGMLDATVMVAYLPQGARTANASQKAVEKTFSLLHALLRQIEKNKNVVEQAKNTADLKRLKKADKKAILLAVENGYGIGKDLANLQKLADLGVIYITLSHNGHNDICDSHKGKSEHNGLSAFGKEVVKEMNRLGIMVDISHTSEKTSWDVLAISEQPVVASHSSAKALCNHSRNISDDLMRAIAQNGGVIQVCLYSGFLKKNGKASVKEAVDHIDHIVKTAGIDHVGIGSDFDGGGGIKGVNAANEIPQITMELLRRGYSEEKIAKIWGGNWMRVMDIVQKTKQQ